MPGVRYWLTRLSFALLAVGFVLGYEGLRLAREGPEDRWPIRLRFIGAALCIIIGLVGARLRHRAGGDEPGGDRGNPPGPDA
jgi:hypothetical protein